MEENAWGSDEKFGWRKDAQLKSPKIATMISLVPEQDPWKQDFVQELTPSPTPELKSVSLPHSAENSAHFYEKNIKEEISPVEAIKNDLLTLERRSLKGQEEEQIYSLHATADDEDLIRKVLTLQEKLKGEIIKVFKSQECHKNQVDENKMLKEYVQNLMKSSASLGTDRFGRSIATERSSSFGLGLKKKYTSSII